MLCKIQQLNEKRWCNESAATIKLKCNEIFTRGSPKKLKDLTHKWQLILKVFDAEDIKNERIRNLDLPLEIINVT